MKLPKLGTRRAKTALEKADLSNPERAALVVGLRNPGERYEGTRHNIGHEVVSRVAERAGVSWGRSPSKVNAASVRTGPPGRPLYLIAPFVFMNESGRVVRSGLDYWKIGPAELLVVHDDIDLPFGRLRLQVAGGSGGHNGIRSIEQALGTREFSRLKVGVGRPPGQMDPADYVLRSFAKAERGQMDVVVEDAADVVEAWSVDPARAQEMAAHRGRNS